MKKNLIALCLTAAALTVAASAPAYAAETQDVVTQVAMAAHEQAAPAAKTIPALKVVPDCGACQIGESVRGALVGSYLDTAKKSGYTITEEQTAVLKISDYSERSAAGRAIFGVFAGTDNIKGTLSYEGQSFGVEDTARSAIFGIEAVARNVGEESLTKLAQAMYPDTQAPATATGSETSGAQ